MPLLTRHVHATSGDLLAWQQRLGFATQAGAAQALGMSLAAYKDMIRGVSRNTGKPVFIDRRTALACAALEAGLTGIAAGRPS